MDSLRRNQVAAKSKKPDQLPTREEVDARKQKERVLRARLVEAEQKNAALMASVLETEPFTMEIEERANKRCLAAAQELLARAILAAREKDQHAPTTLDNVVNFLVQNHDSEGNFAKMLEERVAAKEKENMAKFFAAVSKFAAELSTASSADDVEAGEGEEDSG